MKSIMLQVCDAVVSALEQAPDGTFDLTFTPVRAAMIEEDLSQRQGLTVTVLPLRWSGELLNRKDHEDRAGVVIAVQRGSTPPQATARIDECIELVESIIDYMRAPERRVLVLDDGTTLEYFSVDLDPPYLFTHLAELNTFTSLPAISYRYVRSA